MKSMVLGLVLGLAGGGILTGDYYRGKIERVEAGHAKQVGKLLESVDLQNSAVLQLEHDANVRLAEYNKLLATPEAERIVIKYREVKSDDCADVKSILDDIRSAGF